MIKLSITELQELFGPNVVECTTQMTHIGRAPLLLVKPGTSKEEKRRISLKLQEWKHEQLIKSVGCNSEEEWQEKIFGKKPKNEVST